MRSFKSLSEQEVLALAIALEEEDARIYEDFADGLKADYPATAQVLQQMRAEEDGHRHRLIEQHRQRFGEHIPLIRRQDVKGFVNRKPIWLVRFFSGTLIFDSNPSGISDTADCLRESISSLGTITCSFCVCRVMERSFSSLMITQRPEASMRAHTRSASDRVTTSLPSCRSIADQSGSFVLSASV